jgi:hypothetical protein
MQFAYRRPFPFGGGDAVEKATFRRLTRFGQFEAFPALAAVDEHVHASEPVDAQLVAKCTKGGHSAVNAASAGGGSGFVGGKG